MKKILILAATALALTATPSFAKGGIGIGANVLTGKGGVVGLLNGRSALVVNTAVTTGTGGLLGAVLGRGGILGGGHGGGCGCGYLACPTITRMGVFPSTLRFSGWFPPCLSPPRPLRMARISS